MHPTAGHRQVYVVAVVVLAVMQFVIVVDETAVSLLGPAVAHEFGLGDEARQVLVTPFAIAFVCALPVAGLLLRLADPRLVVAPAVAAFAVTAAAAAVTGSLDQLIAARAAQGATAAVASTAILATMHVITHGRTRRVAAFSLFAMVSGSGAVAALVVVGPLATESWRWCYWAVTGLASTCGASWFALVRVIHVESADAVQTLTVPRLDPSRIRRLDRSTGYSLAVAVGANAALAATVITVSFTLQQGRGWSPTLVGFGLLPLNAAAALGAVVIARTTSTSRFGRSLAAGTVLLGLGVGVLALVPSRPLGLLVASVVVGLGLGVVFPLVNHGALNTGGDRPLGRAAILGAAQQAGLAAGALVAAQRSGAVLAATAAVLLIAPALAAVLSSLRRGRHVSRSDKHPSRWPPARLSRDRAARPGSDTAGGPVASESR